METRLKFVRLLSLKEMSLRRVVVLLWSSSDVLASTLDFTHSSFYTAEVSEEWIKTFEDKIREKVLKLELPESLQNQMTDMVRPVGLQIKRWIESHEGFISAANNDSPKLCWTTAGTINHLKTAELLHCVVENRDNMCGIPCTSTRDDSLENYISLLWEKLSSKGMELRLHWENRPLDLTGSMLSNGLKFAFSLQKCNKTAAEYFFQKLSRKEGEAFLTIIVRDDLLNLRDDSPAHPEAYNLHLLQFGSEKITELADWLLPLASS